VQVATEPAFGVRLRTLRRERGLTQRELAVLVQLDFTYLSKLENSADIPGEKAVRRIAKELEADPDELLALAGKIPADIREWAARDPRAVRLLRRLPQLNPEVREKLFRLADVD
jgi:transcriptional regulator with XRE-family HTH domain